MEFVKAGKGAANLPSIGTRWRAKKWAELANEFPDRVAAAARGAARGKRAGGECG
ncbi:hypothetical protein BH09ACT5_BH09ACT5_24850 [soil metagenome]